MVIGVIPRPKILAGQPQSAVSIDWSNPTAQGLIGAWTASTPGLLGGVANPVGSAITTQPTPGGRVWRGAPATASDNYVRVERGPLTYTSLVTFEALFKINSLNDTTTSPNGVGIMSQSQYVSGADAVGPVMNLNTVFGGSRISFAVRVGASTRTATQVQPYLTAGNTYHVVCVADAAGSGNLFIYINGALNALANIFSTSFDNSVNNFLSLMSSYVDNTPSSNRSADIDLYIARIYNVAKTAQEIAALYKDPWGMFKQTQFLHTDSTPSPTSTTFFVPRKKVMTSQPQGPAEIDWGNPITQGLATVYVPTTRFPPQDLITKVFDTATTRGALIPGTNATRYSTTVSANWSINFAPVGIPANYLALSLFALFEQYDTTTTGAIFGGGNNSTQYANFSKNNNGSVTFGPNTNSGGASITSPILNTNQVYALAAINQGNERELFVDAVSVASSSTSITFLNGAYGYAGASFLSGQQRRIGLYCGYVWTRRLTPSEIKSLSDNPWQIFKQDGLSLRVAEEGKVYAPFMS